MAEFGDPLSASGAIDQPRRSSLDARNSQSDFQAELQNANDPNQLLAAWCFEGRPRITAALADEGSLLKLAAQLLCETTSKTFGASAIDKDSVEVHMLRAAFAHKIGHFKEAEAEFRDIAISPDTPIIWKRRAYVALGWVLVSQGDFRGCARSALSDGLNDIMLEAIDKYALLVAASRIRAEMGDPGGARKDIEAAKKFEFVNLPGDCRLTLAEAKVCFGEGDLDSAAKLWHFQTPAKSPLHTFPPSPNESISSWLCAFAVSVIVGDLGDFIIEGSRWARHEAANNFAVCALHAGRLDGAVVALEDVIRSFGAPAMVDSVAACNLKTLYELCRTPENARLVT